ncbi:toll/interleukin-1 receptor domain-containing protein [Streptomyces sp. NBC_00663]|uniref:toll/interleukin-1 receptor domain-containing protein n=1 Tax=Streptomyces sp. NBC_00663 TaxID=2975801 RepID=UPI003FCC9C2A
MGRYECRCPGGALAGAERYDVFFSYAHGDGEWPVALAENLQRLGLRVWFDRWEMVGGQLVPMRLQEGLASSAAVVAVVTPIHRTGTGTRRRGRGGRGQGRAGPGAAGSRSAERAGHDRGGHRPLRHRTGGLRWTGPSPRSSWPVRRKGCRDHHVGHSSER